MKTSELKPILKEIEKLDCVNYAEIYHADEKVKVSIKLGMVSDFETATHVLKDKGIWPKDLIFHIARNTNVSIIAYFIYN